MIGRNEQIAIMQETLTSKKSEFIAFTGRRRVGKTFLINQIYGSKMSFSVTGLQLVDTETQILNFLSKIEEYGNIKIQGKVKNWQHAFFIFKDYLMTLPKNRKHVIFIDELPWMCTTQNKLLQILAHLWNDYLSKEKHFVLVICGSATSWITQKVINDRGGLHNRITQRIHLKPFTLSEVKLFLESKKIKYSHNAIIDVYMSLGGIPYYLENIRKGETPNKAIERLCFSENGILRNEYENLYKALFDYPENHEAIVAALAKANGGLTRENLIQKSKVKSGGPFTRAISDLVLSGFVLEEWPYGKAKKGMHYRLIDEFSVFHHRFLSKKATPETWQLIANRQPYKIWKGFAFESICMKHIGELKNALGIRNVYTEVNSFEYKGSATQEGFQIDLLMDRNDNAINLFECKYYDANFEISKKYMMQLLNRKANFREITKTKKLIFNTLITNYPIKQNTYSMDSVDVLLTADDLFN